MGIIDTIKKRSTTKISEETEVNAPIATEEKSKKRVAKKVVAKESSAIKGKVSVHGIAHEILLSPVVSEKSTMKELSHAYTFFVPKNANKIEIKKAIFEVYGVRPTKVRTVIVEGKAKRSGRVSGRRSDFKKAIVTTPKDQKLSIHEGV